MTANNLLYDTASGAVTLASTPNWDAACGLTGGNCTATNATDVTPLAPSNRIILSWNDTQGVAFAWPAASSASTLTEAQMIALSDNSAKANGQNRLDYLRGERSKEQSNTGGFFRTRASVLGDIINSSPTWVGPPMAPYPSSSLAVTTSWKDNLFPTKTLPENASGASTYSTFQNSAGTRQNVVDVGRTTVPRQSRTSRLPSSKPSTATVTSGSTFRHPTTATPTASTPRPAAVTSSMATTGTPG